jgi:hypothetical protein
VCFLVLKHDYSLRLMGQGKMLCHQASYDKKAGEALARSIVLLAHMFSNPSRDDDINTERKRVTRAIIGCLLLAVLEP